MAHSLPRKICTVIRESTPLKVEKAILRAKLRADYLELRLDYLKASDLNVSNLRKWVFLGAVPIIATCRRKENGGEFTGSEAEQVEILKRALEAQVAFLDLEIETVENFLRNDLVPLRKSSTKVIASYHNFEETPPRIESLYWRLLQVKPDVLKIATFARSFSDNDRLLALLERAKLQNLPMIAVAMGDLGLYSRIIAPSRGALFTYASIEKGRETAPGQLSVEDLSEVYLLNEINAETQIYGVIGYPVGHSLSPHIHNPAFRKRGLNFRYLPFSIQDLQDFGPHLRRFAGFSVTIPHKVAILSYVDELDNTAHRTGAANTLVKRGDQLLAYNTDVHGIRCALQKPLEDGMGTAVLLGTGGAARSAAVVLQEAKCRVTVLARNFEKARLFAEEFGFGYDLLSEAGKYKGDLLVNATPIGMSPKTDETPFESSSLRYRYVFDMVYNPLETRLMREARGQAKVISGVEMFVAQAAKQFELWTGLEAPQELMREVVLEKLGASKRVNEIPQTQK